jgi:hypothetical protein
MDGEEIFGAGNKVPLGLSQDCLSEFRKNRKPNDEKPKFVRSGLH